MTNTVLSLINDFEEKRDPVQIELDLIIQNEEVVTLFQPIFDTLTYEPFAYEALSRGPENSELHMPDALFSAAAKYNRVAELDCLCRKKAIENFQRLNLPGKLSVNICPGSLIDPSFQQGQTMRALKDVGLRLDRVILELTEQQSVEHEKLKTAAEYYKNMGFSIALDDLGAGYSSLRLLAELKPDYIKIDKFFVTNIHANDVAGDFVRLIQDLAQRVNCKVIAEGLEQIDDMRVVQRMGVGFGQGYLLGKPQAHPTLTVPQDVVQSVETVYVANVNAAQLNDCELVNSLLPDVIQPCQSDERVSTALARFQKTPHLLAIAVLKENKVVGILLRDEILNIFSTPFGHSLYHRSTAASMMQRNPLQVHLSDRLVDVSQLAMQRPMSQVYCPLIVCDGENGEGYMGMLSIQKLLLSITKIQLEQALHSNPLSGLPGNIRIETEVQGRLDHQTSFVLLHFDLDNFKAFNDFYGYERGDKMLLLVAQLLQETALLSDFVGHIGGDDFVMLIEDTSWEDRIWAMLGRFGQKSALLYDLSERKQKFIKSTDRAGDIKRFDLASLSVSALPCAPGQFSSHLEASEVIAEIKHRSKKIKGNSLVVNRRDSND